MSTKNFYLKNFTPIFNANHQFIDTLIQNPNKGKHWQLFENEKGMYLNVVNYNTPKKMDSVYCSWAFIHPNYQYIIYMGNDNQCWQLHTCNILLWGYTPSQSIYEIKKIIGHLENPLLQSKY